MTHPPSHATARLISDLHLAQERPDGAARFRAYLERQASAAEALFILGDFYEFWIGDDMLAEPFQRDIADALSRLAQGGVRLYIQRGNRDFLLGSGFASASGAVLLPDPCVAELGGVATLLTHGDLLCTGDADYQAQRTRMHDPAWQRDFLARPYAERMAFAWGLRMRSEAGKADKRPEIMDADPEAVRRLMREHGVTHLIHGHTHRPARHVVELDAGLGERWVLPDWYDSGGGLYCDAGGCRAEDLA